MYSRVINKSRMNKPETDFSTIRTCTRTHTRQIYMFGLGQTEELALC